MAIISEYSENNKRMAKNTLMLYARMLLILFVTLYTSRIVLNVLGVTDFGVYSIVGGIMVMFSFLNGAMTSATQRFISYELGVGSNKDVNDVFCASLTSHIIIAFCVIVLAETIGLWFVNTHLNIPANRLNAANWVYQFSLLSFVIKILEVPYSAMIVSYEKMSVYAYVAVVEVILKLSLVLVLSYFAFDKLKLYALLMLVATLLIFLSNVVLTKKNFSTTKHYFVQDKKKYKQIFSFSGWSIFGGFANVVSSQGINVLLNMFFGVIVNTATGIATQVSSAVYSFVTNFQTAFKPQLIKYYALKEYQFFYGLLFRASKFSFFLIFTISIPVLLCTEELFSLWLGQVPKYSVDFCRLIIVYRIIDSISGPLWISVQATGFIKKYQIIVSSILLLNLLFSYIALKLGAFPQIVFIIEVLINIVLLFFRIFYLKKTIGLPVKDFFYNVILVILLTSCLIIPFPYYLSQQFTGIENLLIVTLTSVSISVVIVFFIGLNKTEKEWIKDIAYNFLQKKRLK